MNERDLDRMLLRWMADGPHGAPADVVARALAEARTHPPARVINLPWRGLRGPLVLRPQMLASALSVALVVVALAFGAWLYPRLAIAPASSPSPSVTASAGPTPSASAVQSPVPSAGPTIEPGLPSPSPIAPTDSPRPTPTGQSGDPSPSPRTDLEWQRVGLVDGDVRGLLAIDDGYVAYGSRDDGAGGQWPMAWFSVDGAAWEGFELAEAVTACPGDSPGPDSAVAAGVTDGSQVVLVGWLATAGPDCLLVQSTAWVSNDGRSWTRSEPIGPKTGAYARLIWATDGMWEAAAWADPSAPAILWRSADGLAWSPADTLSEDDAGAEPVRGVAEPLGQRLVAMSADGNSYLIGSSDPLSGWTTVEGLSLPPDGEGVEHLIAASDAGPGLPWMLVHDAADGRWTWASDDGQLWQRGDRPVAYAYAVAPTQWGFLAVGLDDATEGWKSGMTSSDGLRWAALLPLDDPSVILGSVVDGPAGVIAIEAYTFQQSGSVWRVVPRAEQGP